MDINPLTMEICKRNLAQTKRFIESGMELEEFLALPEEAAEVMAIEALAAQRDRMRPHNF